MPPSCRCSYFNCPLLTLRPPTSSMITPTPRSSAELDVLISLRAALLSQDRDAVQLREHESRLDRSDDGASHSTGRDVIDLGSAVLARDPLGLKGSVPPARLCQRASVVAQQDQVILFTRSCNRRLHALAKTTAARGNLVIAGARLVSSFVGQTLVSVRRVALFLANQRHVLPVGVVVPLGAN